MKSNKRKYYIVLIVLVIYFIFMFLFVLYPSFVNKKRAVYLMVDNVSKWKYVDQKWQDIPASESNLYNWQKFDIYQNHQKIGNYFLVYSDGWRIYDQDRKPVVKDGVQLLAIRTNQKYQYASFVPKTVSDEDMVYVEKVLSDNQITTRSFSTLSMFSYDLDSDGEEEKVFTVSNIFNLDIVTPPRNIFNFIFVVKDDKIITILNEIDTYDNMYDHCKAYVDYVIDVDNNGKYEIITGCGYYSDRKQCMEMYEYIGGKYQKVKACEST